MPRETLCDMKWKIPLALGVALIDFATQNFGEQCPAGNGRATTAIAISSVDNAKGAQLPSDPKKPPKKRPWAGLKVRIAAFLLS